MCLLRSFLLRTVLCRFICQTSLLPWSTDRSMGTLFSLSAANLHPPTVGMHRLYVTGGELESHESSSSRRSNGTFHVYSTWVHVDRVATHQTCLISRSEKERHATRTYLPNLSASTTELDSLSGTVHILADLPVVGQPTNISSTMKFFLATACLAASASAFTAMAPHGVAQKSSFGVAHFDT